MAPIPSPSPHLQPRQTITTTTGTVIIPSTYGSVNSGPTPGTIVGIVLGSVGGFLLLLWLLYTCFSTGPGFGWGDRSDYEEEVVVKGRRRRSHASAPSRRVSETIEVRHERGPSPVPVRIVRPGPPPVRVERIIVDERRESRREVSRGGSDEVVVIEDHSPPRRSSKSKRESRGGRM